MVRFEGQAVNFKAKYTKLSLLLANLSFTISINRSKYGLTMHNKQESLTPCIKTSMSFAATAIFFYWNMLVKFINKKYNQEISIYKSNRLCSY